jgi:uncharacterized protein YbjT (DUF2867 family)
MKILVTGGTGNVGSRVVAGLLARGIAPGVLVRTPAKAGGLPKGTVAVAGDFEQPESLAAAFAGVERLFLLTALAPNETEQGLAAVNAAVAAGVRRIVYMTIHNLDTALHIPHFGSKKPVEDAIAASGLEYSFIQPNNFYQVDLWFQEPITGYGVYPQPIGNVGLNRVDVRDIADASIHALLEDGHNGQAYPLVGPDTLTADQVAATWSRHLGSEVQYSGGNLDAWAAQAAAMMPGWMVHDLRIMYDHFQQHGLIASAHDFTRQAQVLGHAPRRFEDFVAETAAGWRGAAAQTA